MALDWRNIRPLNGARDQGFEELCAQLARAEQPFGSKFVRKGTPDAGVECYAILSDGSEWAWQSKYFDHLGDAQWAQIDRSVKTALEKHPKLVRYFVCVPLDRADARTEGKKSAQERWDDRVVKWSGWAADRDMTVEFIYWGSHELFDRLARPSQVGRVQFWFDVRGFDDPWFRARLEEALRTAGPRYTPELHVDLPIAWEFEVFGRTDRFFDREKARARGIRNELRMVRYHEADTDPAVDTAVAAVSSKVDAVLAAIGAIDVQATGSLPFEGIVEKVRDAEEAAEELSRRLDDEANPVSGDTDAHGPSQRVYPFRRRSGPLRHLMAEFRAARESFAHADQTADNSLMIVRGAGSTGKTHLLCDVARQRISAGRPTVLLMGQRFVSDDEPWSQALQQLDLSSLSAEKFVGALEAAAQAAGSRALVMIDALNEGAGKNIWLSHLAAFLAPLENSPWIGVVLAVRSSFEEFIVPESERSRAAVVTHTGFMGHEYEAAKTFFTYFDLDLPSTPLLAPEFQNPLFLKALCKGLHAKNERRLPRGFRGITVVFDSYLNAVNKQLASNLDFDPRTPLVRRAVEAVARAIVDTGSSWLTSAKAKETIDSLLPGRDFGRSLYRGLLDEGVLIEDVVRSHDVPSEVTAFAYERLTDHFVAKDLLSRYLDVEDPAAAFSTTGGLAFICDNEHYVSPGLLEALSIQIPEQAGKELYCVARPCADRRGFGDAFRQSLVWRTNAAFSKDTRRVLNKLCRSGHDLHDTLNVLLTVATLPEHPLNGWFLHQRLRKETMPDRDSWWSVYLHRAYGKRGAVDRLVDWASSLSPSTPVEDEVVDLSAVALSWMLTTSNRFLRDRTTAALVSLLTGRVAAVGHLIGRFADVDDPYVTERVYAVAYAVAMRSREPAAVGALATCVYERIFASGSPPPHILLRDYARGVVERALHLGSNIDVVPDRIRPPYGSSFPAIPTEEDINGLKPNWSEGSSGLRETQWARNRIGSSVLDDDFARYVIGTNSSQIDWLSLRLEDPQWKPPSRSEEVSLSLAIIAKKARSSDELGQQLAERLFAQQKDRSSRHPPRFELCKIQRYVLWRVFDLGWTTERFGRFDEFVIGHHGRDASKAERIGKKYQWIAFHEITALISDHYQYREQFREEDGDQVYEGPWQGHFRDIDPSCTLRSLPGGNSWDGHAISWWASARYDAWGDPCRPRDWARNASDLPKVEDLLVVTQPEDGSRWVNCQGFFYWKRRPPVDRESADFERRELSYMCTGYLVRADDAQAYLRWAKGISFVGRSMPAPATIYGMFLGEHAWAPASRYFGQPYHGDDGWVQPTDDCPVKLRTVTREYLRETSGFDCAIEKGYTIHLPNADLVGGLGIQWSGHGGDFMDGAGRVVAQDPRVHSEGPNAMLFRIDLLREFLMRHELTICWAVRGVKRVMAPGYGHGPYYPQLHVSGAYVLDEGRAEGFLDHKIEEPAASDDLVVDEESSTSTRPQADDLSREYPS